MWPENISFTEDYAFKSSPESSSDISFTTDNMGSVSDEDFITQLSSDLDIPLLLNSGEDEMAVLNSFLDKTPDEILSDFVTSHDYIENDMDIKQFDFLNEILPENTSHTMSKSENNGHIYGRTNSSPESHSLSKANKELQKHSQSNKNITYFDYLNEIDIPSTYDPIDIKLEDNSEESCSSRNSLEPSTPPPVISVKKQSSPVFFQTNILPRKEVLKTVDCCNVQVVPQINKSSKVPIKRVPIKPKTPYTIPLKNSNIVLIKNIKSEFPNKKPNKNNVLTVDNSLSSNIMVLDNIPVNNLNPLTPVSSAISHLNQPVTIPSLSINYNNSMVVDPKILKKQERRIKNRESASISRKKKKDYLNSLEEQVKNLTDENRRLLEENSKLKERLSFYEDNSKFSLNSISPKRTKPALVLCAFLLVVGLNLNLSRSPFLFKPDVMESKNSDYPKLPDHVGRNLLWTSEENKGEKLNIFSPLTMCPASINQTESARLLLELEKWIGKPQSIQKPAPPNSTEEKLKPRRKKMRLDLSLAQIKRRIRYGPENESKNELQVFSPRADHLYSEFFEAINRQDDTFYVVSFSEQHMLLPALYHNKTRRPKMSLLMPSVFSNETSTQSYIPLMQIDCEVLDTKLVNVKYGSIPRPYRYYGNVTKESDKGKGRSDNTTSSRKYNSKKAYKPYFLSKNILKTDEFN